MKSLLISVVVVTAAMSVACAKKSKHEGAPAVNANNKVEQPAATLETLKVDLQSESWASNCDENQQRTRIEFQKTTELMFVYNESCSRGQNNIAVVPEGYYYEVSQYKDGKAQLQMSELTQVSYGRDTTVAKGKPVQALTVSVDGDILTFVGLLPEGSNFPMSYKRVKPVVKQEKVAGV